MCEKLGRDESLMQKLDRSLLRQRLSLRERLKRRTDEIIRLRTNLHHMEDCADCRDEAEARRILNDVDNRAWALAANGCMVIDRDFTWSHYESGCDAATCPHGSLTLHGVTVFQPGRLRGVAKLLYAELAGPERDLKVEILPTRAGLLDGFCFKVSWNY